MLYLGWIVAAFLLGVLLTVGAAVYIEGHRSLRERFNGLGTMAGKDYAEIIAAVKPAPLSVEIRADGGTLRTWRRGNYAITLLFDRQDCCLGVMEERE